MQQTINAIYMKLTTVGADGSATATGTTAIPGGIQGFLYSIYVKPLVAGWATTTDITITEVGANTPARTILTLTDKSSAAASYPVRVAEVGATGASVGTYAPMAFDNNAQFRVAMAQANVDTDALEVWFYLMR
jgi:hypothetical protein